MTRRILAAALLALALAGCASAHGRPAAHHPRMICEGTLCQPASVYWGGPRDWTTPWGTVGPHEF